jgi:hypothetical protein
VPTLPATPKTTNHRSLTNALQEYFAIGFAREEAIAACESLRAQAYSSGSVRELLMADILAGVTKKRLRNAARHVLPIYSSIPEDNWDAALRKPDFMKELWPSQHAFGENGLFQGRSAVIQMPTSAGKTRGIELVIRSAFYSGRATLAVVVAPFRALCSEITTFLQNAFYGENVAINELSDALEPDYSSLLRGLWGRNSPFL